MNIDAFTSAPWHIQLHTLAALAALGLGAFQLIAPKGTLPHRQLGYVWVCIMLVVAITAIFIQETGGLSWIHVFVPVTLFGLAGLIYYARRKHRRGHSITAIALYAGALLTPGAFTLLPGRLMHTVVMGG
ncbi:DUF2306 domain-containing protein [Glycocaulis sp.]|uniref:DUF2306 domain-containing protein n=1 Tax=Glycocaulis sp. TaxID=1969725 RepID=UPI003D241AF0